MRETVAEMMRTCGENDVAVFDYATVKERVTKHNQICAVNFRIQIFQGPVSKSEEL